MKQSDEHNTNLRNIVYFQNSWYKNLPGAPPVIYESKRFSKNLNVHTTKVNVLISGSLRSKKTK